MKELALITVHGMGKIKPRYFKDLEKRLSKKLGTQWEKVSFQNVQYAPSLQLPQEMLWQAMNTEPELDLDKTLLRKFLLYGFGDAGSLEHSAHRNPEKYLEVQQAIQTALLQAYGELGQDSSKPVIIIAQSLGGQVISNYLWDAGTQQYIFSQAQTQHMPSDQLKFLQLKSLNRLITTGCNIPLFIAGLENRECFQRPNAHFEWDNYFDADDALGWPLHHLGPSYEFINDIEINAGGVFTSWNALSHGRYWSDKNIIKPLARQISQLLS